MKPRNAFFLALAVALLLVIGFTSSSLIENLDADHMLVIQDPVDGDLHWYTDAGMKWQGFGKATQYPKRGQFWFTKESERDIDANRGDLSIKIRFNDGAHALLSGSLSYDMPRDMTTLTQLHVRYGSQEAIEEQLMRPAVEKAVYMTGPLMSSKESYAEKRNELIRFIKDQIEHGVYRTFVREKKDHDPMTGAPRTVSIVELQIDKETGQTERQDESPITRFAIGVYNLSINSLDYEDRVEAQIQSQQEAMQQVQTAIARAKEAEQEAITAAKRGEAAAAKSKWEQEVIKAKMVTEAQQRLEVQTLAAKEAAQYNLMKKRQADADATYRRQVMNADGALSLKLEAWVKVNQAYARALAEYKGQWVPGVVMGTAGGGTSASPANDLINLFKVQTADQIKLKMIPQK